LFHLKLISDWYFYHSINNEFTNGLTDKNALSVKLLLVIVDLSVSLSVIKLLMDLLTGKAHQQSFLTTSFHRYFSQN
jgi:hypothetical protein